MVRFKALFGEFLGHFFLLGAGIFLLSVLVAPVDLRAQSSETSEAEAAADSDPAGTPSSAPQSAAGSSDTWQFMVAPYLFLAPMNGNVDLGGLSVDINASVSAILERLEFAIAGRFEVRKGSVGWSVRCQFPGARGPDRSPFGRTNRSGY